MAKNANSSRIHVVQAILLQIDTDASVPTILQTVWVVAVAVT